MKKIIITLCIALMLGISTVPVHASGITPISTVEEGGVTPASEETIWYQRIYNGMLQKRLWSITYQKWLTDWIDVMPIE